MQTLPLDRKSPRQSTRTASSPEAPARPRDAPPPAARQGEKAGNLGAILAQLWAPPGAQLGALARRIELLGRGLLRVGVEPLAYSAGLWLRLTRLLRASRELMEMGHLAARDQQGQSPRPVGPRKTHRSAVLRRFCGRRERGRVGRMRPSSSVPRSARRLSHRPARDIGVFIPR
ncbi:MAG: hypothetical protein RLZZ450_2893 [Pseudomonadota bacterium]|jgi:hypothetical protein